MERLLSPEILLADHRLAQKQVTLAPWRKRRTTYEIVSDTWRRIPRPLLRGVTMLLVMASIAGATAFPRQAFEVRLAVEDPAPGEALYRVLGVLQNADGLSAWLDEILAARTEYADLDLFLQPSVSVQPVWKSDWDGKYTDPFLVREQLWNSLEVYTEASILQVSDKATLPLANAKAANQVLDNLRLRYVESKHTYTIHALFAEEILVMRKRVKPEEVISIEEATEYLLQGCEEQRTITVQMGDSLWDLAMARATDNNMDIEVAMEQFIATNPHLQFGALMPGDTLILPAETTPLVGVVVMEIVEVEEEIPYDTITVWDDTMYRYESYVSRYGIPGMQKVRYEQTKENGIVKGRLQLEVISDEESGALLPVAEVIVRGTKMPDDRGTGTLIWPIWGRLSSYFGWRDLGYHRGIDIANGGGTIIVAADSGIITYAGWDNGGLGNLVTIDHRDGRVTRYAHLAAIYVSVGDGVSQGSAIGVEGNTGYSFGHHLHFELLINGSYVDPLDYLP
ncbi:MAG: M23 family metallopeptidase [Symbiobacteriaceae bacterium]|nr:M23 family metallopeptidase [Symbiobacteriaceae bacterium]